MLAAEVLRKFPCTTANAAFIAGEWLSVSDTIASINPATEDTITTFANCSPALVDQAVKAAREAFAGPHWGHSATTQQRVSFLRSLAGLLDHHRDELSQLDSLDEGKPFRESSADISDAIALALHLAELLEDPRWPAEEVVANGTDDFITVVKSEPIGVVAAITPWNYPLLMAAYKVLPALAAGCTVVLKPSELAPLSSLVLAELCREAGLPPGALNVVPGLGSLTGDALSRHPGVDKLSFTGSVATARKVMTAAALGPRPLSLELGGKSPALVFDDADVDAAVDWLITGFVWLVLSSLPPSTNFFIKLGDQGKSALLPLVCWCKETLPRKLKSAW